MSTVLTAEKMHIQDAPRRLRFWRPHAAGVGVNRIDTDCAHHDCDCDEFHRLSVRQYRSPLGGIGELLHVGSWRRLPASIKKTPFCMPY